MMKKLVMLFMLLSFAMSANAGSILLVTDGAYNSGDPRYAADPLADSEADLTAWLEGIGHNVTTGDGWAQYQTSGSGAAGAQAYVTANSIDLVIISRNTNSGAYNEFGWNDINVPMLNMSPHLARRSRWDWAASNTVIQSTVTEILMDSVSVPFTTYTDAGRVTYLGSVTSTEVDGGTIVAMISETEPAIIRWDAGVVMQSTGSYVTPQTTVDKRTLWAGIPYHEFVNYTDSLGNPATLEQTFGHYTPEALDLLEGEIDLLLVPEPATMVLLGLGSLMAIRRKK